MSADDYSACYPILQQGLYKYFTAANSGNFSQDVKSYFLSNSFLSDMNNNKWQGGVLAVIDAVPVKLDANASNAQITQFRNRIQQSSTFTLDQSFYSYLATAIPDDQLAAEYTKCVIGVQTHQTGFSVYPVIGDDTVVFVIKYGKLNSNDPSPTVQALVVMNNGVIQSSPPIAPGAQLGDSTSILCGRDPNYDLVLDLQTDKGAVVHKVSASPAGFNKDLPVGTALFSCLNWNQFQVVTQNNAANPAGNLWSSQYSRWAPMDGRPVPNSALLSVTNNPNVPDIRGCFIRGLNVFDPNETTHNALDPDTGRTVGTYQADDFQAHDHGGGIGHTHMTGAVWVLGAVPGAGGGVVVRDPSPGGNPIAQCATGNALQTVIPSQGGAETRPKNIALYCYIRIN